MTKLLKTESTLTDRYQTTIPDAVRKALDLNKRDKICYTLQSNGQIVISKLQENQSDPLIDNFLNFLEMDMKQNPHHLSSIDPNLIEKIADLVNRVDFNLDESLPEEKESDD